MAIHGGGNDPKVAVLVPKSWGLGAHYTACRQLGGLEGVSSGQLGLSESVLGSPCCSYKLEKERGRAFCPF